MHSREQYLESLREEYQEADKRQETRLLNEARKRTHWNRKVPIRKLAHPAKVRTSRRRPLAEGDVRIRSAGDVGASLRDLQLFLRATSGDGAAAGGGTLRKTRELHGSKEVAEKLGRISAKTIDRLAGAREARVAIKKKPESSVSSANLDAPEKGLKSRTLAGGRRM